MEENERQKKVTKEASAAQVWLPAPMSYWYGCNTLNEPISCNLQHLRLVHVHHHSLFYISSFVGNLCACWSCCQDIAARSFVCSSIKFTLAFEVTKCIVLYSFNRDKKLEMSSCTTFFTAERWMSRFVELSTEEWTAADCRFPFGMVLACNWWWLLHLNVQCGIYWRARGWKRNAKCLQEVVDFGPSTFTLSRLCRFVFLFLFCYELSCHE